MILEHDNTIADRDREIAELRALRERVADFLRTQIDRFQGSPGVRAAACVDEARALYTEITGIPS